MQIDLARGRLTSGDVTFQMSGTLTAEENGQEVEVTLDQKSRLTTTLSDTDPMKKKE